MVERSGIQWAAHERLSVFQTLSNNRRRARILPLSLNYLANRSALDARNDATDLTELQRIQKHPYRRATWYLLAEAPYTRELPMRQRKSICPAGRNQR